MHLSVEFLDRNGDPANDDPQATVQHTMLLFVDPASSRAQSDTVDMHSTNMVRESSRTKSRVNCGVPAPLCRSASKGPASEWRFGPGLHDLGGQVPVPAGVTSIVIEPGAYVLGGFITTDPGAAVNLTGGYSSTDGWPLAGGVLAGTPYPFHSPNFSWALVNMEVNMDKGEGHFVHGVTLVDPPQYYFRSYADSVSVSNVRLASAWTYNTDGVVVGAGGSVSSSFIRSNDDSIKLYSPNTRHTDITVWQMGNGDVLQTGRRR